MPFYPRSLALRLFSGLILRQHMSLDIHLAALIYNEYRASKKVNDAESQFDIVDVRVAGGYRRGAAQRVEQTQACDALSSSALPSFDCYAIRYGRAFVCDAFANKTRHFQIRRYLAMSWHFYAHCG